MRRKIHDQLVDWKQRGFQKPLLIIGARQIGKSWIIEEFLQQQCNGELQYLVFNLFDRADICELFDRDIPTETKITQLEILHGEAIDYQQTVLFFDEAQESEGLIAALKFFAESDVPYKVVCAGSLLGVKLKRMSKPFPVGKVEMLDMLPMDFEEYLWAINEDLLAQEIRRCAKANEPLLSSLHEKALGLMRNYLCSGGMPEVVADLIAKDNNILSLNTSLLENIRRAYLADMRRYVSSTAESIKIEAVYDSIPSQLGNSASKFMYSGVKKGARAREYQTAVEWLISSGMVLSCTMVTLPQIPLKAYQAEGYFKLYLSDCGLLCNLVGLPYQQLLLDSDFFFKGIIIENYVATQLAAANKSLFYWREGNSAELDFLLTDDESVIPVEVKAGRNKSSASMRVYQERYHPASVLRISTRNFGSEGAVRSLPPYALFTLAD